MSLTWKIQMHLQDIQSLVVMIFLHRCLKRFKDKGTSETQIFILDFIHIYSPKATGTNGIGHEKWNVEEEEDYSQDEHLCPACLKPGQWGLLSPMHNRTSNFCLLLFLLAKESLLHIHDSFLSRLLLSHGDFLNTLFPGALHLLSTAHVINTSR